MMSCAVEGLEAGSIELWLNKIGYWSRLQRLGADMAEGQCTGARFKGQCYRTGTKWNWKWCVEQGLGTEIMILRLWK